MEIWKEIDGFPLYEVSNLGRVRSWRTYSGRSTAKSPRMLKLSPFQGKKYLRVGVTNSYGKVIHKRVHRLVLEAFIGPCPEGMEGCHNDGDPTNNKLENLRWDTHSNNLFDAIKHGTIINGEDHPKSALTKEQVAKIKAIAAEIKATGKRDMTGKIKKIATELGVSLSCVYAIAENKTWVSA